MSIMRDKLIERRRFIRLETPVSITFAIPETDKVYTAVTKNISADGLRFETTDRDLKSGDMIELKLAVTGASSPVHARGKVIWKKKLSLEDAAPFDCGIEFVEIEEDNKNTFLKFLCDLLYTI